VSYLTAPADRVDRGRLDSRDLVVEPSDVRSATAIDEQVTRRDRQIDLEWAKTALAARIVTVRRGGGEPVGYAVVKHPMWWAPWHPEGTEIAPIVVLDPVEASAVTAAVVLHALDAGTTFVETFVPESNPAHDLLLAAGFGRDDEDLYMASAPDVLDPARYLPAIDTA
jgi:hypothetical protein